MWQFVVRTGLGRDNSVVDIRKGKKDGDEDHYVDVDKRWNIELELRI